MSGNFKKFISSVKQYKTKVLNPTQYRVNRALEQSRQFRNSRQFSRQKEALMHVLELEPKNELAYRELFVVLRRTKTERPEFLEWLETYATHCQKSSNHVYRLIYYRKFELWDEWHALLNSPKIQGDAHLLEQEQFTAQTMAQFPLEKTVTHLKAILALAKPVDHLEMIDLINIHLKQNKSFYLNRVSDGEGTFIGLYNEWRKQQSLSARSQTAYKLITRLVFKEGRLTPTDLPKITEPLIQAYLHAPALIMPDEKRLRATIKRDWRGYFGLASAIEHLFKNHAKIRAQHVMLGNDFRNLATRDRIQKLVSTHPHIGLITCHAPLKVKFEALGAEDVRLIQIPPEALSFPVEQRATAPQLYPERHAEVLLEIAEPDKSRLFFVGAGILAKQYGEALANAGHVAIDLGSAVDQWLGIAKRTDANATVDEKFIL